MDNRNNVEGALVLAAIGIAVFILQFIFAVFVALALFFTAALSVIALLAIMKNGVMINGDVVTAREGKMFFVRGIAGVIGLPIFLAVVFSVLGQPVPFQPEWVWLAGFALGSTGGEYILFQLEQEKAQSAEMVILPPLPDSEPHTPPPAPTVEPVRPFQFASWDDEEQSR